MAAVRPPEKSGRLARSAFVVAQMCLALVLLAGSGLLIRSFVRLVGVDPGFDASHLLTFKVSLPSSKYGTDKALLTFFHDYFGRDFTSSRRAFRRA